MVIGVDIGGTNIRAGIVDSEGRIISKAKGPTDIEGKGKGSIKPLLNVIKELMGSEKKIRGIGIGAPGAIDIKSGTITFSPNLKLWEGISITDEVSRRFKIPVVVDNDANAYAYGEWWKGAAQGCRTVVAITLGTGVGGGIIIDGDIYYGEDGIAGEIGHMTVNPAGLKCNCGNTGCLEVYSSATGIAQRAIEAIESKNETVLRECCNGNYYKITAENVYEAAMGGDSLSREILREAGMYLGIGIANIINLLNPEAVIVGGGAASAWDLFIDTMKKEISKRAFNLLARRTKVLKATLGDDAGVIGACGIAYKNLKFKV